MAAPGMLQELMEAIDRREWDRLGTYLHEEFQCSYVHTGETFNADQWVRANAEYPGFDRLVVQQVTGDDNTAACRSHVTGTRGDALQHFECATFIEVSDGLIRRMTEVWTDVNQEIPVDARPRVDHL